MISCHIFLKKKHLKTSPKTSWEKKVYRCHLWMTKRFDTGRLILGHEAKLTAEPADFGKLPGFSKEIPLLSTAINCCQTLHSSRVLYGVAHAFAPASARIWTKHVMWRFWGSQPTQSSTSIQLNVLLDQHLPCQGMVDVEPVVKSSSISFITSINKWIFNGYVSYFFHGIIFCCSLF